MSSQAAETRQQTGRSGWRILLQVVVIAMGLLLGAFLGVIGAFFFGLINISC
jgi:hypothetical protein